MRSSRRSTLAITVSQPCHEDWARMTPAARGRHCAACEKVVVDFTHQTDAELLAWFAQPANHQTCGRFRPDQLDRPLQPPPAPAPRWRRWLAAAVALWALRETAPTAPQAQTLPTQHLSPRLVQPGQRPSSPDPRTMSGQVLSAPLVAVPGLELGGMLGGAGVRGVQIRTPEEPKHNQPLLSLEDWLR